MGTGAAGPAAVPEDYVRPASSSGVPGQCTDWLGRPSPCYLADFGWLGSDGCYYQEVSAPSADLQAVYGGAGSGPGAWYDFVCAGLVGTGGGTIWLPAGPAPVALPPPVVLAQQALSQLVLPRPVIRANPAPEGEQLVSLPTWLWLEPSWWGARDATASVPGQSVTATATPVTVTWAMGDGQTLVCHGPGTPYRAEGDPAAASPDCGHTYRRSSVGHPDDVYPVSAMVTWAIGWAGGGEQGSFPALQTTGTAAFRVAEYQALVTANSSAPARGG